MRIAEMNRFTSMILQTENLRLWVQVGPQILLAFLPRSRVHEIGAYLWAKHCAKEQGIPTVPL